MKENIVIGLLIVLIGTVVWGIFRVESFSKDITYVICTADKLTFSDFSPVEEWTRLCNPK